MPLYKYQAFDQAGVLRKGSEDAVSESDLRVPALCACRKE